MTINEAVKLADNLAELRHKMEQAEQVIRQAVTMMKTERDEQLARIAISSACEGAMSLCGARTAISPEGSQQCLTTTI